MNGHNIWAIFSWIFTETPLKSVSCATDLGEGHSSLATGARDLTQILLFAISAMEKEPQLCVCVEGGRGEEGSTLWALRH